MHPTEKSLKIAHISDLHFGKFSLNPFQLFSKRWVGNLNLLFKRQREFKPENLENFAEELKAQGVEGVIITGDFTTTSTHQEFALAKTFVKYLEKEGFWVIAVPGNHDHYTKRAYREKRFHQFIPCCHKLDHFGSWTLKKDHIEVFHQKGYWVIALDTTLATALFSAGGDFSEKIENTLDKVLGSLPKGEPVILCNHFPFFDNGSPRNHLKRKEALKNILEKYPSIKLYLHGHNHRNCIADLRASGLPIVSDSGSTAHTKNPTWNLFSLMDTGCDATVFSKDPSSKEWQKTSTHTFSWKL